MPMSITGMQGTRTRACNKAIIHDKLGQTVCGWVRSTKISADHTEELWLATQPRLWLSCYAYSRTPHLFRLPRLST